MGEQRLWCAELVFVATAATVLAAGAYERVAYGDIVGELGFLMLEGLHMDA